MFDDILGEKLITECYCGKVIEVFSRNQLENKTPVCHKCWCNSPDELRIISRKKALVYRKAEYV